MLVPMSIVKLEIRLKEIPRALQAFKESRKKALDALTDEFREAISTGINQLLNAEIDVFLGQPDQDDNKRNGFHPARNYVLKGIGAINVRMPKDRQGRFESAVIPAKERVDLRIKAEMAILQLAGLSSRNLSMISRRLLGVEVGKDSVNETIGLVAGEARKWLDRPIEGRYWALYVDGTHFKIQRRGSIASEPSLVVLGIDASNHRSILAIEPGTKDSKEAWRAVFASLKRRGLSPQHVRLGVMDGIPGLESLFREEFPNAVTQRCWVHALKNTLSKAPERLRDALRILAHRVMYAKSENEARVAFDELKLQMASDATLAVQCLEKDLDSLLQFYKFDREFWVALRTTNSIETINRQLKRRTKGMDTMGEQTLECVLAFVALKIEMGWAQHPVNSKIFARYLEKEERNVLEGVSDEMGLVH